MNFPKWFTGFLANQAPGTKPENIYDVNTRKDYSNVGVDQSFQRADMLAATGMSYPTVVGSNSVLGAGGFYGGYFNFSGWQGSFPFYSMHALVRMYLWMAQDPDIRYAVDEIVNEATSTSYDNAIVKMDLDGLEVHDALKDRLNKEFEEVLGMMDFKRKAQFHFSDFYVNGRVFYKLDVDKKRAKLGVQAVKQISPFDVVAYFDAQNNVFRDPESMKFDFKRGYILTENAFRNAYYLGLTNPSVAGGTPRFTNYYVAVPEELIVYQHCGLADWRSNVPISYLHLVLKTLNQLRNLRDAMIIYRMTRAPERFVFNVEVGKMQSTRAQQYVAEVANSLKQTFTYSPETGQFKDHEEKLQIYKDWFFPKVDGKGTDVNVLKSGEMTGQLQEVQELQKILFRQMFVPYSRYFEDHASLNFGSIGDVERMEVKFYKFVAKLQSQYNTVFLDILKIHLSMKNVVDTEEFDKMKGSISFKWGSENVYNETKSLGVMTRKAQVLGSFDGYIGKYGISEGWVTKNVMGFTKDEIKENEKQVMDDLKKNNYRERIKTGQIQFDEDGEEVKDQFGGGGGEPGAEGGEGGEAGGEASGGDVDPDLAKAAKETEGGAAEESAKEKRPTFREILESESS